MRGSAYQGLPLNASLARRSAPPALPSVRGTTGPSTFDLRPSTCDPLRDAIGAGGREGEAVADPVLGDDVLRRGRVLLDLAAQAPDVELEVLGVADVLRAPDPLEEPLVRDDLAGVIGQDEEEAPLGAGQLQRLAALQHLPARQVDGDVAVERDDLRAGRLRQRRGHP